jgi:hypothetical protein
MIRRISKHTVKTVSIIARLTQIAIVILAFYITYKLLLEQTLDGSKQIIPIFILWVLSAYIVIPKIHRLLTDYYLPNYFVGRVRSPSGLLSDPVNLAFFGSEDSIHRAMEKAGWQLADPLTPGTLFELLKAYILKSSYPNAPVGNMYLFNRKQDFAYEQQVGGTPHARHHIRFWATPKGWRLPGGHQADWLAAATYDRRLGLKLATGQIDHLIHEDIDAERDYIVATLQDSKSIKKLELVEHFTDAYHSRNNGGDNIKTDGSLPFITL